MGEGVEWLIACGSVLSRWNTLKRYPVNVGYVGGGCEKSQAAGVWINATLVFSFCKVHRFCQMWLCSQVSEPHPTGEEKKKKVTYEGGVGGRAAAGKTSASEERNNNKGRCAQNEKHSSERCLRSYLYPGPCHLRYEITRGQAPVFGGQGAIRAATVLRTLAVEMPPLIKMHGRDDSLKGAGSKRPILLLIRSICRIITRIMMRLESNLRRPTSTVPLHMCRRFSGAKPLAFQRECQLTCIVNLTWGDTTPPWFHQWSRHF